jgi:hypothetical protein
MSILLILYFGQSILFFKEDYLLLSISAGVKEYSLSHPPLSIFFEVFFFSSSSSSRFGQPCCHYHRGHDEANLLREREM